MKNKIRFIFLNFTKVTSYQKR